VVNDSSNQHDDQGTLDYNYPYTRRLVWCTAKGSENFVVPCPFCKSVNLRLEEMIRTGDHYDFILRCLDCGRWPMHLGVNGQPNHPVRIITD